MQRARAGGGRPRRRTAARRSGARPGAARAWRALALVCGLALVAACADQAAEELVQPTPVAVEPVRAFPLTERILATGELVAVDEATLAAEVAGQVSRTWVDEGQPVVADQVLLEIDREKRELELANQRALVAETRAHLSEQARDARRIRTLHRQGVASDARLETADTEERRAQARLAAAEAKLALAERELRYSSPWAPFAGWIGRRFVSKGDFVSPGDRLFDLVALDPVKVVFSLAERDSGRVRPGLEVDVRVTPYPDDVFPARVTTISPRIDPATRTLRVQALIANPDGRLRPGLFARADLGVAQREGVAMVPEEAVLQRADGPVVFRLVGDDRVERRPVETGVFRDGLAEIVSGVDVGDRVVVRGQSRLFHDAVVSVREADGSPAGPLIVNGAARAHPEG